MRAGRRAAALLWAVLTAALPLVAQDDVDSRGAYERSVVGLFVTNQVWDEDRPWAKQQPKGRNAAAVVLDGGRLLTTADVFDQATNVQLETFGRSRQFMPRVVFVDESINLALLELDDPAALEGLDPVRVAERTPTSGILQTVRWRRQQLESAASHVLRFEVARSWSGRVEHAFLEMRTDMVAGGWSEPVFRGRELVGITVSQVDQTSRAIPVEILRAFLERANGNGTQTGVPALGVLWQINRDPAVTSFLGQSGEPRGIIVRQVPWGSSGCGVLEPRDILMELGGQTIDAEGYYRHPRFGQLGLNHILAESYAPGDTVKLKILRGGQERELEMSARAYPASLDRIPLRRVHPPPYVIVGGLVLRELDLPYLRTWGDGWDKRAPLQLLGRYFFEQESQTPTKRRFVIISSVLPSAFNIGYHSLRDEVVQSVNGRPVGRLEDVLAGLEQPQDGSHVIELTPDSNRRVVVLDATALEEATTEILEQYDIAAAVRLVEEPLPPGGGDCAGGY